jgi:hypothetical protein
MMLTITGTVVLEAAPVGDFSRPAAGTVLPAIEGPGLPDESANGDDHPIESDPKIDYLVLTLGTVAPR